VIRFQGNVLLIGRSGTGKTTCAALRLWARNKLFTYLAGQLEELEQVQEQVQTQDQKQEESEEGKVEEVVVPAVTDATTTTTSTSNPKTSPCEAEKKGKKISYNSVFLSLSPVLCNQVKRYYEKLDQKTGKKNLFLCRCNSYVTYGENEIQTKDTT